MKYFKRFLCSILAVCLVFALVPNVNFAVEQKTEYVYELASTIENDGVYAIVLNKNGSNYAVSNVDREVDKGLIIQEVQIVGNRLTAPTDSDISMESLLWRFSSASAGGYTIKSIEDDEYIIVANNFLTTGTVNSYCWEYRVQDSENHVIYNLNTQYYMTNRGAGVGFMDVSYWPTANHEYLLYKRVAVGNIPVTGVSVNPTSLNMIVGETKTISAQVLPLDASDRSVTWTSSDSSVATVDAGRVTAVSSGAATITATTNDGGFTADCAVNVIDLDIEGSVIGYKLYEPNNVGNGFISFDLSNPSVYTQITSDENSRFLAGEFYNGVLYMITPNAEVVCVNPSDWSSITITPTPLSYSVCDLAYDYSTDTMFAFGANNTGEYLLSLDLLTGEATRAASISGINGTVAMACSEAGQLYLINTDGDLYSLNKVTGVASRIGNTGRVDVYPYYQCAFFDHNTDTLYWMQEGRETGGQLNYINTATGEATCVGSVGNGVELIGAFTYYYPNGIPAHIEVEGVCISPTALNLETGAVKTLSASVLPVNATQNALTWTSSNPGVASITNGVVTALSSGVATITVTSVEGGFSASCTIIVSDPVPPATIYAFRYYLNSELSNGAVDLSWVSFTSDNPGSMHMGITTNWDVEAAEYYNGNIYGYDNEGDFFYIDMEDGWRYYYPSNRVSILGVLDMAYDYSQNRMYAVREDNCLYYISDMATGEQTLVGRLNTRVWAMCCATDGKLYGIAANGYLYIIDKDTAQMTVVGSTGVDSVHFRQSMTYDHNTGKVYWCAFNLNIEGHLREVDLLTGLSEDLGVLQYNADLTGMFIPYEQGSNPTPTPTNPPAPTNSPTPIPTNPPTPTPTSSPAPIADGRLYAYSPETLPDGLGTYAWVSLDTDNASDIEFEDYPPYIFHSAVYTGGNLYAFDEYGFLFKYDITDWSCEVAGYCTPYLVYDMDIDPVTGTVYALVYSDGTAIDTSQFAAEGYYIGTVDLSNGSLTEHYMLGSGFMPVGVAAIGNGMMLSVDVYTNRVVTFDLNGNYTLHGSVGFTVQGTTQSLAYCAADNLVYWGAVNASNHGLLVTINPNTFAVTNLGDVGQRLTCLFFIDGDQQLPGDANGDGHIGTSDALLVLRHATGTSELPNDVLSRCDMNGDGVVTSADSLIILRMSMGITNQTSHIIKRS